MVKVANKQFIMAAGSSMWPLIHRGDLLFYDEPPAHFSNGQILLYRNSDGQMVCHRLMEITEDSLLLRSDLISVYDPPITMDKVIGIVTAIEHCGRLMTPKSVVWRIIACIASRTMGVRLLALIYKLAGRFAKVWPH